MAAGAEVFVGQFVPLQQHLAETELIASTNWIGMAEVTPTKQQTGVLLRKIASANVADRNLLASARPDEKHSS